MDLLQLINEGKIESTGEKKKLKILDTERINYDVFGIPPKYLYYNDQNGRVNTTYKNYEKLHGKLNKDDDTEKYNLNFEDFITSSNPGRMKDTINSIKKNGQAEPIVVLRDGRVIDGNRRLTAIRKLDRSEGFQKVEAVVLNLDIDNELDKRKIKKLELRLQEGIESRVPYDPIDKIFDRYTNICVEKRVSIEDYKTDAEVKTKDLKTSIEKAKLIIDYLDFINSSKDNYYLAKILKLDGPIEEILNGLKKLEKLFGKKSVEYINAKNNAFVSLFSINAHNRDDKESKKEKDDLDNTKLRNEMKLFSDFDEYSYERKNYIKDSDKLIEGISYELNQHTIDTKDDLIKVFDSNKKIEKNNEKLERLTKQSINSIKIHKSQNKFLNDCKDFLSECKNITQDNVNELDINSYNSLQDTIKGIKNELNRLSKLKQYRS